MKDREEFNAIIFTITYSMSLAVVFAFFWGFVTGAYFYE
jgi:hypothetical protein